MRCLRRWLREGKVTKVAAVHRSISVEANKPPLSEPTSPMLLLHICVCLLFALLSSLLASRQAHWCICTMQQCDELVCWLGHRCFIFGQSPDASRHSCPSALTMLPLLFLIRWPRCPSVLLVWLKAKEDEGGSAGWDFCFVLPPPSNSSVAPCITMRERTNPRIWVTEKHCQTNKHTHMMMTPMMRWRWPRCLVGCADWPP